MLLMNKIQQLCSQYLNILDSGFLRVCGCSFRGNGALNVSSLYKTAKCSFSTDQT